MATTSTVTDDRAGVIVRAIAAAQAITVVYVKANGMMTVRAIRPFGLERCANGNAIVRAICLHADEPRCFTLEDILTVEEGNVVARRVGFLR